MPMIVMTSSTPLNTCASASHQPASTSQMTLPATPNGPVPKSSVPFKSRRLIGSRPNGQKENPPITKQARPQGMPTMDTKASRPTNHQSSPIHTPPNTNHKTLPINRKIVMTTPY